MPYIKQWMASPLKNKKYRVILSNGKTIDFGDKRYEQYRDTTPLKLYSNLDHNDKKRQMRYYSRHVKDYGPFTADWMSKHYLWSGY
jgi:hypothetical protein